MSIEVLKMILKSPLALVAAVVLLAASGCTTTAPTNTAAPSAPVTSASPAATPASNTSTAASTKTQAELPVTLPVLDAMFTDESFAGELKSKLQLTDEQIEGLRKVAGEERANLDEGDESSGTTPEATRRAAEKVRSVIGAEKATAFNAFVSERWSAGGEALASAKPNSVPSDTRIVVNAPAYRMDVFQNGKLVKIGRAHV